MNKNKLKRIIIFTTIILLILIICSIFIKTYFTSKKYIISLLNNGDKNVNYVISYNDGELIDYVKGLEEKMIFSNGKIYYANYEKEESILIDPENKIIQLESIEKKSGPHSSLYVKDINNMNFEYEDIKNVNGNECIVVKLSDNKNNNVNYLTKRLYINKKNGIIEKIEKYTNTIYGDEELISKQAYKMYTEDVTDNDIEQPNLAEYSDYMTIDNR